MLKILTDLPGVSGCEDQVRDWIMKKVAPYCDAMETDKLGNLLVFKKGKHNSKKMMLCAHMDEVGLIIKSITDKGFLKFAPIGGVDSRVLLGKNVFIGNQKVAGVIGNKAVHMTTKEERKKAVLQKEMYIDIGADTKEAAEKLVKKGDVAVFESEYIEFGNQRVKAKALDDRAGCYELIRLLQETAFYYDTWCCFTVQEEIGLRGATIAAKKIMPDIALILESTICADTFGTPKHLWVSTMGAGGVLSVMEKTSRSDWTFVQQIIRLAEEKKIPCQLKRTGNGGNEAGAVQVNGTGVKTAVISVPCRYIHSPVSVLDKTDLENTYQLAKAVVENIGGIQWNY